MVRLRDLKSALRALINVGVPSPVFPALLGLCALEVAVIAALTEDIVRAIAWYFDLGVGAFHAALDAPPGVLFALAVGLVVIDTARGALMAPLRRIVIDGEQLKPHEVAVEMLSRMPALFFLKQLIALVATLLLFLCMLVGATVYVVPYMLVSFVLMPAVWAVTAKRQSIAASLSQAVRITRRNMVLVVAVQTAVLALGMLAAKALQDPMMGHVGAWSLLITYQFVNFAALSAMFLALDKRGEFDR